jgi:tripartite-type tricarboxylate transporter receptor subunit TctC
MLGAMHGDSRAIRALWPALLLAVLAYVVVDFVQSPFGSVFSNAVAAPEAHLTLWLAQTETSASTGTTVRIAAGGLQLHGHATTVGVLPGGSSRAVVQFFAQAKTPGQLLVVSSDTLADLAQERASALVGEEPLQAALAQRLLARADPVAVLSTDSLAVAVPARSPIRDMSQLMADMRAWPQGNVFATTEDNWAADSLAALVHEAGVNGVVRYRVFPATEDLSLALSGASADVVLAPRSTILPQLRDGQLRELAWPAGMSPPPSWVELLAAPGTHASQLAGLRAAVRALIADDRWRALLRRAGQRPSSALSGAQLQQFLETQSARVASLQQVAQRIERH